MRPSARTTALLLTAVLVVYFVLLSGRAIALIETGTAVGIGLGVGVLLLPFIGCWVAYTSIQFGLRTEQLAKRLAAEGTLPDTSDLPRMPSGRVDRAAADAWFEERRSEVEAAPEDWRAWFRLAHGYDIAGDRRRAREAMRKALELS
ncbi:hypothetical protein ALI144C_48430 [Actinosynnema sp. ALI-1.44]|uniref:tetratricopeptide repeat protein n=1 Tax=Actinosynnema sp. ALI-1.44 TaxID=1933779 RepID=UPI00097BA838|nr:tetratricopeptide repeat protein [Actinosynnema sp. ALI-1.44]ONI70480.1 hypothetical protein ALI144C_48430 [Actinosynnema sp. ALI-1.44]